MAIHRGQGNTHATGHPPHVGPTGLRIGVKRQEGAHDPNVFFGPSVSKGKVAAGLTSGEDLRKKRGGFTRGGGA